jgi:hypothetical protein
MYVIGQGSRAQSIAQQERLFDRSQHGFSEIPHTRCRPKTCNEVRGNGY